MIQDYIQDGAIIILALAFIVQRQINKIYGQRLDEIERKRTRFYKALANPDSIEAEMEKGARLREMHDANRTTLPREDAVGQHAKVYRPKMRSKLPSPWNPPRP